MANNNAPLEVSIADGKLTISIGLETLAFSQNARDNEYKVVDAEQFAKDVSREMEHDWGFGESELEKFFDKMADKAIDQGSLGVFSGDELERGGSNER